MGTVISSVELKMKLWLREIKDLLQGHTTSKWWNRIRAVLVGTGKGVLSGPGSGGLQTGPGGRLPPG